MGYRAWITIACALGAQVTCVQADAPVTRTFERTVSSPNGDVTSTVRTVVRGSGAKATGSAMATAVDDRGKRTRTGFTFSADALSSGIDTPASPGDENAPNEAIDDVADSVELKRNELKSISTLTNACGCVRGPGLATADIRKISDTWMAKGEAMNTHKLSNMIWAWGQVWIVVCVSAAVPLSVTATDCCVRYIHQRFPRLGGRLWSLTPALCVCSLWIMTLLVRLPVPLMPCTRLPVLTCCRPLSPPLDIHARSNSR